MIVHFAAARKSVRDDIEVLRAIVSAVHEQGHVIARDWIEPYYRTITEKKTKDMDVSQIYKLNVDAIERADIIIIEASNKSFSSGFQLAAAINKKKPTLVLVKEGVDDESAFTQGLNDPLVQRHVYNAGNLKRFVISFLEENNINSKDLRFNFVIDRQLYNHIRWKSFKMRKTKAEVVRELLNRDMENGE